MTPEQIRTLAKQAGADYDTDESDPMSLVMFYPKELTEFVRLVREPLETHNTMLKAALRGVIKVADRKTDEFDAAHAALLEAAKGEAK